MYWVTVRYETLNILFLNLTEVFLGLLKNHDAGSTTVDVNVTFYTFQFKTMTTATSTAFLPEDENDEDTAMDENTKKNP